MIYDFEALKILDDFELLVHDMIEDGNEVIRLTPKHYQINGDLHVYPMIKKYVHVRSGKKGQYRDIFKLIKQSEKWDRK